MLQWIFLLAILSSNLEGKLFFSSILYFLILYIEFVRTYGNCLGNIRFCMSYLWVSAVCLFSETLNLFCFLFIYLFRVVYRSRRDGSLVFTLLSELLCLLVTLLTSAQHYDMNIICCTYWLNWYFRLSGRMEC